MGACSAEGEFLDVYLYGETDRLERVYMVKKNYFDVFELIDGNSGLGSGLWPHYPSIKRQGPSVRPIKALEMRPMSLQKTSR